MSTSKSRVTVMTEKFQETTKFIEKQKALLTERNFLGYVMTVSQLLICGKIAMGYDLIGDLENANYFAKFVTQFYNEIILDKKDEGLFKRFGEEQKGCDLTTKRDVFKVIFECLAIRSREPFFNVECYMEALEYNRPNEEKFFEPRRKCFKNLETIDGEKFSLVEDAQDFIDNKLDFCFTSMPQRLGKSAWGLFLQSLRIQRDIKKSIFGIGHSAGLSEFFYNTMKEILSNDKKYNYFKIFRNESLFSTNADRYRLDINEYHPFGTFSYKSIDGDITGSTEASECLVLDDVIKDQSEVYNTDIADRIWSKINVLALGRKKSMVPIYATGTLWSTNDPFTRLIDLMFTLSEEGPYGEKPLMDRSRMRIRRVAWCDSNGNSQFAFEHNLGYDTNSYLIIKQSLGEIDYPLYSAMYLSQPLEREAMPFKKVEYFNMMNLMNRIRDGESFFRFSATDTAIKTKGDFIASGYFYYFESTGDIYLVDVVYTNKGSDYSLPRIVQKHVQYQIERSESEEKETKIDTFFTFGYSSEVKRMCIREGLICNFKTHTASGLDSKVNRILNVEAEIRGIKTTRGFRVLFLCDEDRKDNPEYNLAMKHLASFSYQSEKNDDFPDMISQALTYCVSNRSQEAITTNLYW